MLFILLGVVAVIFLFVYKYSYTNISLVNLFSDKLNTSNIKLLDANSDDIYDVWHRIIYHVNNNKKINILSNYFEIYKSINNLKVIIKYEKYEYGVYTKLLQKKILTNLPHNTTQLELYNDAYSAHFHKNTISVKYFFDYDLSNLPSTIKKIKFSINKVNTNKEDIHSIVLHSYMKLPFNSEIDIDKNLLVEYY